MAKRSIFNIKPKYIKAIKNFFLMALKIFNFALSKIYNMIFVSLIIGFLCYFIGDFSDDKFKAGIGFFGIIATISSLCFSASSTEKDTDRKKAFHYVGKKLLICCFSIIVVIGISYFSNEFDKKMVFPTFYSEYGLQEKILPFLKSISVVYIIVIIMNISQAINVISNIIDNKKDLYD